MKPCFCFSGLGNTSQNQYKQFWNKGYICIFICQLDLNWIWTFDSWTTVFHYITFLFKLQILSSLWYTHGLRKLKIFGGRDLFNPSKLWGSSSNFCIDFQKLLGGGQWLFIPPWFRRPCYTWISGLVFKNCNKGLLTMKYLLYRYEL